MDSCDYCKRQRELMGQGKERTLRNLYAKDAKIEIIKAMKPTVITRVKEIEKNNMYNRNGNFIDKFLAVTYTVADTDMTKDNRVYLEKQLISNFKRLTEIKDMPCKGKIYVIENTKGGVPHLHGLVRMSVELQKKKRIAATDPKFKGKNKIIINGKTEEREEKLKMLLRPINVSGWIGYMKKEGEIKGEMERIKEGWKYEEIPGMIEF